MKCFGFVIQQFSIFSFFLKLFLRINVNILKTFKILVYESMLPHDFVHQLYLKILEFEQRD